MKKYIIFLCGLFYSFYVDNCYDRQAAEAAERALDPAIVALIEREVDRKLAEKNCEIRHLKRSNKLLRQTDRRIRRFEEGCLGVQSRFDHQRDEIVDLDQRVTFLSRELMVTKRRLRRTEVRLTCLEKGTLGLSEDVGYDLKRFKECKAAIEANQRNVMRLLEMLSRAKMVDQEARLEYEFPIIHKIERASL